MKRFWTLIIAMVATCIGQLAAQHVLTVEDAHIIRDQHLVARTSSASLETPHHTQMSICSNDSLAYAINKSSSLKVLNVNGSTSAAALSQYYDAPQPITISKLRFYAFKTTMAGGASSNLVVELYQARPDSLPMGAPIRTAIVAVDTNRHGYTLSGLEKVANFPVPAVMTGGYVVVVRNNSANPVGVVVNDYAAEDGASEWLAGAQMAGTWRHSYDITVEGHAMNCDILLDPVVSYALKANFDANPGCISGPSTVNFVNTSSPVLAHRMYNVAAFLGRAGHSVIWNFGDNTGNQRLTVGMDTTHYYAAAGSYTVGLNDTLFGWSVACRADTMIALGQAPEAHFGFNTTNLGVQFNDLSSNVPNAWYWTFGDGNTSTLRNPNHTYASAGVYQVCLWSSSVCGSDSFCRTVVVTCPAPVASFSSNATGLDVTYTDWSSGGVNAWMWTFGDGGTSSVQNPTHSYAMPGNYQVCLKAYGPCGMDSSWFWMNVTCAAPATQFSQTINNLTVAFTDVTGGNLIGWIWNFGDGVTSTLQNPIHSYAAPGTYTVCLTTINDCGRDSICNTLGLTVTGLASDLDNSIQVYPNPVADQLHIQTPFTAADDVQITVTNLMGGLVKTIELGMQTSSQVLDVSDMAVGSYLLHFQTADASVVKRINVLR